MKATWSSASQKLTDTSMAKRVAWARKQVTLSDTKAHKATVGLKINTVVWTGLLGETVIPLVSQMVVEGVTAAPEIEEVAVAAEIEEVAVAAVDVEEAVE